MKRNEVLQAVVLLLGAGALLICAYIVTMSIFIILDAVM